MTALCVLAAVPAFAQSDADFRQRVTDVISQVQRAYWDLVFALRDKQNQIANLRAPPGAHALFSCRPRLAAATQTF